MSVDYHYILLRKVLPQAVLNELQTIVADDFCIEDLNYVYEVLYKFIIKKEQVKNKQTLKELLIKSVEENDDNENEYLRLVSFLAALGEQAFNVLIKSTYIDEFNYLQLYSLIINSGDYDTFKKVGNFLSVHPDSIVLVSVENIYKLSVGEADGLIQEFELTKLSEQLKEAIKNEIGQIAVNEYMQNRHRIMIEKQIREIFYVITLYPGLIELVPKQMIMLPVVRNCLIDYYSGNLQDLLVIENYIMGNYVERGIELCKYLQKRRVLKQPVLDPYNCIKEFNEYIEREDLKSLKMNTLTSLLEFKGIEFYNFFEKALNDRFAISASSSGFLSFFGEGKQKKGEKDSVKEYSKDQKKKEKDYFENLRKKNELRKSAYKALLVQVFLRCPDYMSCFNYIELANLDIPSLVNSHKDLFDKSGIAYLSTMASIKANTEEISSSIKCKNCKKNAVTYFEVQTRSADEPMTIFYHCTSCGIRWRG